MENKGIWDGGSRTSKAMVAHSGTSARQLKEFGLIMLPGVLPQHPLLATDS